MLRSALAAALLVAATVPALAMDLPLLTFPEGPALPPATSTSTADGK
jgi:hypothetical protein